MVRFRGLRATLGILGAMICGFFVMAAIGDLATGGAAETGTGVIVGLLVFFGLGLFASGWLAWTGLRPPPRSSLDQQVLQLAQMRGGRLTVVDVMSWCGVPEAKAKATLDRMHDRNLVELETTEQGVMVYIFPSLTRAFPTGY
jgi:hypothetical protein